MTLSETMFKRREPESMIMTMTPAIAAFVLDKLNPQNRSLRPGIAERYGEDMKSKQWHITNQGVGFNRNGHLFDGQHRLFGCVDADAPFETLVLMGCDSDAREVVDVGIRRSEGDVIALRFGEKVQPLFVGTAKAMMGISTRGRRRQETLDFMERHREAIQFAVEAGSPTTKRISIAPVLAVIGRAYYSQDRAELKRFMDVLRKGLPNGTFCEPALSLGRWLVQRQSGGGTQQLEVYKKTETALDCFLNKKRLTKVFAASKELYLLNGSR